MEKSQYLLENSDLLNHKTVLDLACHTGESTELIHQYGAQHVYAVDVRKELVKQSQARLPHSNIEFFVGDITDPKIISDLVAKSNTITCFGVLYHLFDHFRFFSHILKPNIEHVLLETEFGIESLNPEMCWGFEHTDSILNGWFQDFKITPYGAPNISWILQAASIFGFRCDWIEYYGIRTKKTRAQLTHEEYVNVAGPDWPPYATIISTDTIPEFVEQEISELLHNFTGRRMIIRLYNTQLVQSTPLEISNIFKWPH
jgi:SAM-dependent methyltransferase